MIAQTGSELANALMRGEYPEASVPLLASNIHRYRLDQDG